MTSMVICMKKTLFFGLLASLLCLCVLPSCGGDTDEQMSENLIGHWRGQFVRASYNADSTAIVYTKTDANTVVSFSYPYIIVQGKKGEGFEIDSDGEYSFDWEVKYGNLYLYFRNHPERDLEIFHYYYPVDSVLKGRIERDEDWDNSIPNSQREFMDFELHKF